MWIEELARLGLSSKGVGLAHQVQDQVGVTRVVDEAGHVPAQSRVHRHPQHHLLLHMSKRDRCVTSPDVCPAPRSRLSSHYPRSVLAQAVRTVRVEDTRVGHKTDSAGLTVSSLTTST